MGQSKADIIGKAIEDLDTPALLLDAAASQRNIQRMAEFFRQRKCQLRPHFKNHKCTTLAHRQAQAGSLVGFTCAKVGEAEVLADCSIANEDEAINAARKLVNAGVQIAMITLAEEGVVYATPHDRGHVPAIAIDVIDSTGASDSLTATVVFGILNDFPIDESVRLGSSAAALTLACSDTVCDDLSLELLYDHLII